MVEMVCDRHSSSGISVSIDVCVAQVHRLANLKKLPLDLEPMPAVQAWYSKCLLRKGWAEEAPAQGHTLKTEKMSGVTHRFDQKWAFRGSEWG